MNEMLQTRFEADGYVVVDGLLDTGRLAAVREEYAERLRSCCRNWVDQSLLPASVCAESFDEQLLAVMDAGLDYFQPLDISLPIADFPPDVPMHTSRAVFEIMRHARVLDAVEALIGPEITSNPIQHVRIKPPMNRVSVAENRAHIVRTDWHQDRAVAMEQADRTRMVTLWLAITDATVDNGCLQVIPGSHRQDMLVHCPQRQLGIPSQLIDDKAAKALPVKAGGAILFHPLTIHSSLDNRSDAIRWSFDLRYNVTGDPTGRPQFPEFVARSRQSPSSELRDHARWQESWMRTRARLALPHAADQYHRWDGSHPVCA